MSNKWVKVSKHQSMELFPINGNAFRYLKITKTKFSHVRHSTWIQTLHFRESKHVVCVPTSLTHISLKTNADIREHAAKGKCQLRRFVGCLGLDCQTQFLQPSRTVSMPPASVSAPKRVTSQRKRQEYWRTGMTTLQTESSTPAGTDKRWKKPNHQFFEI